MGRERIVTGMAIVCVLAALTGAVMARRAGGGLVLSTVTMSASPDSITIDERTGRAFVVNSADNTVSVLDTPTGAMLLRVVPGVTNNAVPPVLDERTGHLFVANFSESRGVSNTVYMLDARSGAVLHTLKVAADASLHQFAVDDRAGRAYLVAGVDGTVSVIDTRTGALVHGIRLGQNASAVAVDQRAGRVFVTGQAPMVGMQGGPASTGPGTVTVLDAYTGAILSRAAVGVSPVDVAVDERSGHAFVVASGGWLRTSNPWRWLPAWLRRRLPFIPRPPASAALTPGSIIMLGATRYWGG